MTHPSIGVVIPTYQAAAHLPYCLPPLLNSPLKPRVLVVDSSSKDDTVKIAQNMGAETRVIPKLEFNHGATREKGRQILKTSIVVMITQDAYPFSEDTLECLVKPILEGKASVSYGRQIPHKDASILASFARSFNYPEISHIRNIASIELFGIYTFFCSNSCAAYLNSALDEVGGFPSVLFGEDSIVVAELLLRRHQIAYAADAKVYHSHDYTLKQEFKRHLEIGFVRNQYRHLFAIAGSDKERGRIYAKALIKQLWNTSPWLIPYALLQLLTKWFGYRLGELRSKKNH